MQKQPSLFSLDKTFSYTCICICICKSSPHFSLDKTLLTSASAFAAAAAARRSEPPSAAARTSAARIGSPATRKR